MARFLVVILALSLGLAGAGFICGCSDDNDPDDAPAMDVSGRWTGTYSDSHDTGGGSALEFLFSQSGNHLSGTASFLGPINGSISGRNIRIEGSDVRGVIADDLVTMRGSFTDSDGFQKLFVVTKED